MAGVRVALLIAASICVFGPAAACIYKFGTSPDSLAAPHGGTHWDHGMNGDNWDGVDATGKPWTCMTGLRQSPINVPSPSVLEHRGSTISSRLRTRWAYPTIVSNGSNVEVINNGHTIQIEWLSPYAADVEIVVPAAPTNSTTITAVLGMNPTDNIATVRATPIQFHFHTVSEHLVTGKYYPLELHIVHKVTDLPACAAAGGCYSVTGILFELVEHADNELLDAIWAAMPMREGTINYLPAGAEIPLGDLLPSPDARDYVTYEGSLTTPPCTEGLLWHVMLKPQVISLAQWQKYKTAVGLKDCTLTNSTSASAAHAHRHASRRMLLQEEQAGSPDDYTCNIVAYGYNYRSSQKLHGRTVKVARAM